MIGERSRVVPETYELHKGVQSGDQACQAPERREACKARRDG